jgi:hypothetical protein
LKRVRYNGAVGADLVTLGVHVEPGDVIEVNDDFVNSQFSDAPATMSKTTKEEA